MRVILLFRARVSMSLRRLSNLNPIAEPKQSLESVNISQLPD